MRNYHGLASGSVDRARTLRRDATDAEKRLWSALRESLPSVKFRRQVPLGAYVADFLCFAAKLIIEVDGGQHAERTAYDEARTRYFEAQGYHVIRFWNHDVLENTQGVVEALANSLSLRKREGAAKLRKGGADASSSPSHSAAQSGPLPLLRGEGSKGRAK